MVVSSTVVVVVAFFFFFFEEVVSSVLFEQAHMPLMSEKTRSREMYLTDFFIRVILIILLLQCLYIQYIPIENAGE